jgi:hypothetical protein
MPRRPQLLQRLALTGLCLGLIQAAKPAALPAFDPVRQQGDVKVTLLRISRSTSFTNESIANESNPDDKTIRAVPGLEVVYQVEILGNKQITGHTSGTPQLTDPGKQSKRIETVIPGGRSSGNKWRDTDDATGFSTPVPADPARTIIDDQYLRGSYIDGDAVDITIKAGFNGDSKTFNFDAVPLVTRGK